MFSDEREKDLQSQAGSVSYCNTSFFKNGRSIVHYDLAYLINNSGLYNERSPKSDLKGFAEDLISEFLPRISKFFAEEFNKELMLIAYARNTNQSDFMEQEKSISMQANFEYGICNYSFFKLQFHIQHVLDRTFKFGIFRKTLSPLKFESQNRSNQFEIFVLSKIMHKLIDLIAIDSDAHVSSGQGWHLRVLKNLLEQAQSFGEVPKDFIKNNLSLVVRYREKPTNFADEVLESLEEIVI